jgi:hypothetical protein
MNANDALLWRRGLEKLTVAPSALTDAEREVIAFYGTDTDRRRLSEAQYPREPAPFVTKSAAAPPVAPSPAASRAWVKKALEAYTAGLAATLKQALDQRDTTIKALEDRIVTLEADQAVRRELVP